MLNANERQIRLDALKVARQILNREYTDRRAEEYNSWMQANQTSWDTHRVKLPPPAGLVGIVYPSEKEIVAKALEYYNFVSAGGKPADFNKVAATPVPAILPEPVAVTEPEPEEIIPQPIEILSKFEASIKLPSETEESTISNFVETPPVVDSTPLPVVDAVPPELKPLFVETPPVVDSTKINNLVDTSANRSSIPLIKSLLKKGLLPSWLKADAPAITELGHK